MRSRLNGNQLGVILSDLYRRYWMLRMKNKLSVGIQTELTNADMKRMLSELSYRNVIWIFTVHRKSLW
jgi:hypothetical protein